MELRIFAEPQEGATYEQQLAVARAAESHGLGAFFRSDHLLRIKPGAGEPGPTDSWVTLGAIARETTTIRLGTMVTSATFRLPGPLAVAVAQVDAMSAGRVELGLGTGWFEAEHRAYGIPFPPFGERFERLEEQLEIVTGMWSTRPGESFEFHGRHYDLAPGPALPKPLQRPRPPVIVGGLGLRRTPALAACFAAELNVPFADVGTTAERVAAARSACEAIGRDPGELVCSHAITVCCGESEAELERRAARIGRELADLRASAAAGTPREVVERLGGYRDAGLSRSYLQLIDLDDLDHVALIAAEVMPHLG
ncbi:MAG TPA: LLM class F420-dependent oxidoreductase [Solirubrobacteraceae bacterium]|jgi:F420-dependent oxidoreductase-like protein|nr:LLM class F420-dependent oxidoreductase [Solirubrobacteraceae bacterium]